jgi:Tol biopolymer transport system component
LTTESSADVRPSWSSDGRWIYFGSDRSGGWQIWKSPAQGGQVVQVTKNPGAREAFESFDHKWVYYAKAHGPGIWRVPAKGGPETRVLEQGEMSHWALTHQGICFFDLGLAAGPALKFYSFASRQVTLLRQFSSATKIIGGDTLISVSADGQWILYTQSDRAVSDLMLVENYR